ncbi:MAG: hypothetical protein AAB483_00260, partial [Patescibacteria group bacterium]
MRYLRFYFEILASLLIVTVLTVVVYGRLVGIEKFWSADMFWSYALMLCWIIVAAGYYHQGWIVRKDHTAAHVSLILPIAVFFVQCILFVKGINFNDWSLIGGAVLVNSGVLFSLYNIIKSRLRKNH